MRLIGSVDTEKLAFQFTSFLTRGKIESRYERAPSPATGKEEYWIWVYDEDHFRDSMELLERFKADPNDALFREVPLAMQTPPVPPGPVPQPQKVRVQIKKGRVAFPYTLTHFIISLCALLFFWSSTQEEELFKSEGIVAVEMGFTPLEQKLMFDYTREQQALDAFFKTYPLKDVKDLEHLPPDALKAYQEAQEIPSWKGVDPLLLNWHTTTVESVRAIPRFEKIRQGELWRFFTPCLLHFNFLHILFNMLWVWLLGRQIEIRIGKLRLILLSIIVGVISNTLQYLMAGPAFLGYSGIVVGMAGFIWMRQKMAPWEGYPLEKATEVFLLLFVLAMFALEFVTFFLQLFGVLKTSVMIANTAHIVGGLVGIILARIPFFSRSNR